MNEKSLEYGTFEATLARSNSLENDIAVNPSKYKVLTGDRPTGRLHIGHLFGSLQNRVRLQNMGVPIFVVIADYQVLTDRDTFEAIAENVTQLTIDYLAAGLDPENGRTCIFPHSHIPELNQLLLPFLTLVTNAELDRNPTVKEEIEAAGQSSVNAGMYTYPVHQAADILFCKSNVVPVGKDQLPHLELTRTIARRFNKRFAKKQPVFPEPQALLSKAPVILGLDGSQKMSKSRNNAIMLSATEDETVALIKKAKTDAERFFNRQPYSLGIATWSGRNTTVQEPPTARNVGPRWCRPKLCRSFETCPQKPGQGYERIAGCMEYLGFKISKSTVKRILVDNGISRDPETKKHIDWELFISSHKDVLSATDFFTAEVLTEYGLQRYMVLFFIDVGTRKVNIAGIDKAPDGPWMHQMARNQPDAFDGFLLGKKYLIHDRDPLYTAKFDDIMKGAGVTPKRLPGFMPVMNSFAESFVKSIKTECLNKLIFTSEEQLRYAIKCYLFYYHHLRPHGGLGGRMINPLPQDEDGEIVEFNYLGGLLRGYRRLKQAA